MLLREMFSPIGGPKEDDQEIDWAGDLKFFIDDHSDLLTKYILPAVEKHKKYIDHPKAYTIYIKPLNRCAEHYCNSLDLGNPGEIFDPETIIGIAKEMSEQQSKFIKSGDYE